MMFAIKADEITVQYQHTFALKDISFCVPAPECLTIIGPNGSGKSTLLKALNGLTDLTAGTIEVLGIPINRNNAVSLRKRIGYVPQGQVIDPKFPINAREVVSIGCLSRTGMHDTTTGTEDERVEQAMNITGILHLKNKPIGHLSGGEQQKVAIARALAQEPELLLLDEPTSSLDLTSQYAVLDLITSIYEEKRITTVIVTHILDHIPACSKRIILMREGMILADGRKEDLLNPTMLASLYNCEIYEINRYLQKNSLVL